MREDAADPAGKIAAVRRSLAGRFSDGDERLVYSGRRYSCLLNRGVSPYETRTGPEYSRSESNCCADEGWHTDPELEDTALKECTPGERSLGLARMNGRAVLIGDLPDAEGLRHRVFCVYESSKAKEIVAGAKGYEFGTASEPDCSGITADRARGRF